MIPRTNVRVRTSYGVGGICTAALAVVLFSTAEANAQPDNPPGGFAQTAFDRCDSNGDGVLDRGEFQEGLRWLKKRAHANRSDRPGKRGGNQQWNRRGNRKGFGRGDGRSAKPGSAGGDRGRRHARWQSDGPCEMAASRPGPGRDGPPPDGNNARRGPGRRRAAQCDNQNDRPRKRQAMRGNRGDRPRKQRMRDCPPDCSPRACPTDRPQERRMRHRQWHGDRPKCASQRERPGCRQRCDRPGKQGKPAGRKAHGERGRRHMKGQPPAERRAQRGDRGPHAQCGYDRDGKGQDRMRGANRERGQNRMRGKDRMRGEGQMRGQNRERGSNRMRGENRTRGRCEASPSRFINRFDQNNDGAVGPDEFQGNPARFKQLDRNDDGKIDLDDAKKPQRGRQGPRGQQQPPPEA